MSWARATAGWLLAASAACADGSGGALPPFPPPVQADFPAAASGAAFALRADRSALGGEGAWLYLAGRDGWAWLGESAGGGYRTIHATAGAPAPAGNAVFALPEGEWAAAGELAAFLDARFPGASQFFRGAPALWAAAAASWLQPEDEDQALDAARSFALIDAAAAFAPRLLGRVEAGARALSEAPSADLRLLLVPPLPPAEFQKPWRAPALPEGIALLRVELPAAVLQPHLERRLAGYGLPAPAALGELVYEVHVLSLDGEIGLVSAMPAAWAPRSDLFLAEALRRFGGGLLGAAGEQRRFERGDAVLLGFGSAAFLQAVARELEHDRPQPFAERRWSWPRGALGLIVDLRALQEAVRALAPIPLPTLYSQEVNERMVELVAVAEDGALRLHARWPASLRGGADLPLAGDDMEEWFNQTVLEQALRWLLMPEND